MRTHTAIITVYLIAEGVSMCCHSASTGLACGLTCSRRLCETHAYAIQREGGICSGAEDAGAEHASLSAGALAYMDLGVFSRAGPVDLHAVCAWVWTGQSGMVGGGAGGTGMAGLRGQLPGVEPRPYILRFDEDKPNPLYRRVCYTFAWNAVLSFALLNLSGLLIAAATGSWYMKQIYHYAYLPVCGTILLLGAAGALPRVRPSTRGRGHGAAVFLRLGLGGDGVAGAAAGAWKTLPQTRTANLVKLGVFAGALLLMGLAAYRGALPRTRPIVPGELMVAD